MKRKNVLIITLLISVLLIVSTFGGTAVNMNTHGSVGILDVTKEVYNGTGWAKTTNAELGEIVQFRINVTYYNNTAGSHWAFNITVKDTLPSCLEYNETVYISLGNPQITYIDNNITWKFDTSDILYDKDTLFIIFNASVKENCSCCDKKVTNMAMAIADEHCTGQVIGDGDSATVDILCSKSGIDVEKKVWDKVEKEWVEEAYSRPGTEVRFNITVYNNGKCDLYDIYVNDTLPLLLEYANEASIPPNYWFDKNISWFFPGPLLSEDKIHIEFNATLIDTIAGNIHLNCVDVIGSTEEFCCPDIVTDRDCASVKVEGMRVEKEVKNINGPWLENVYASIGDTLRFRIIIYYYGDYTLYDIHVVDELPDSDCLEYADNAVPKEPDDISPDGKTLTWNIEGALSDGGHVTIEFDANVIGYDPCDECECTNWANVTANECSGDILNEKDPATVSVICRLTADAGGPYAGKINELVTITGEAYNGVPPYTYEWDMDEDGNYDDATGEEFTWYWSEPGNYNIWLKVTDKNLDEATDLSTVEITVDNTKPNKPSISGKTSGLLPNTEYTYNFIATDPDGDKVYYYVDWGDGHTEDWDVPYNSGEIVSFNHSWSNSMTSYNIRAKAKDIYDAESDWAILTVQTPKNKRYYYSFLMKLLEHFPILQKLLQLPIFQQLLKV